ncbi:hypothetical protein F4680DRAFT_405432 [Xylaria scruposa]|nr:hypothetical protein F4680DRAFT_405432 [Xylaria scruposa]
MAEYTRDTNETRHTNAPLCISALSLGVNYHTLLQSILAVGRVRELCIKKPNKRKPRSCTAYITFFSYDNSQKLLDQVQNGKFLVEGMVPTIFRNENARAKTPIKGHSRVLWIYRTPEIVTRCYTE